MCDVRIGMYEHGVFVCLHIYTRSVGETHKHCSALHGHGTLQSNPNFPSIFAQANVTTENSCCRCHAQAEHVAINVICWEVFV